MQHQPARVVGLGGNGPRRAEVELAVDVVFDQRNVVPGKQFDEPALVVVGHQAAQRILELRHQPAGARRVAQDGRLHRVQVDAGTRMRGHFQRFQPKALQRLQCAVERRRFHHDGIARLRDRLQAEIQGFERAIRDDDVGGGQVDAADQVAQRDLPAQARIAGRQVFNGVARVLALQMRGHRLREARQRKEQRRGEGRAQRGDIAIAHRAQDVEDPFADRQFGRFTVGA